MSLPTLRLAPLPTDKALPGSAHIPSVATGVRPHTKRSKIGDRVPVHVGTWYAPIGIVLGIVRLEFECNCTSSMGTVLGVVLYE